MTGATPRLLASRIRASRLLATASVALVSLTALAGGLVAGLHAGLTYNTFPLMDGRLVPDGYAAMHPFWRNLIGNVPTVQFNHRLLATLTAACATATVAVGLVQAGRDRLLGARAALVMMGAAVGLQYTLGVATLISAVRIDLAASHQACAIALLSTALYSLHCLVHTKT